jgi:hypothetical protein
MGPVQKNQATSGSRDLAVRFSLRSRSRFLVNEMECQTWSTGFSPSNQRKSSL